jgi:site-specific DNA-methyltransferase (adenine-specific)
MGKRPMTSGSNGPTAPFDRISQGDCIAGLKRWPAGSIDLAFADPPFNIGYDYDIYDDRREADQYLAWSRCWMAEVARVLKPTGSFWLAIGDEFAAELKLIAHRELGFFPRNWVVWYYTFGVHCTRKFSRSHVHLFYFVKDPRRFTFNDAAIRVPSARQRVYADARANPRGRLPDDTWILRPQDVPDGFAPEQDTWYIPRVCGTFRERAGWHGCQMPEQLLGRIIRACSNPGEIVLDPFAGSGTTLVVAKKLGRRFLGFELSGEYAAQIERRLQSVHEGQPLEGGPEPRVDGIADRRSQGSSRRVREAP